MNRTDDVAGRGIRGSAYEARNPSLRSGEQHTQGVTNVGVKCRQRLFIGEVDRGLGGEMHDSIDSAEHLLLLHQVRYRKRVTLDSFRQVVDAPAGVIHHNRINAFGEQQAAKVRTDEPGTARNENTHSLGRS